MRITTLLFIGLCLFHLGYTQEVYSLQSRWELRDRHNDPDISGSYTEMRVNFAPTVPIYFVFGNSGEGGQPSSISIKRGRPFTDNLVMLNVQALINGEWKKYTLNFYPNKWGEAVIRDQEQIQSVYNDFRAATRLRMRLGYVGEFWGEFPQSSFRTVASKLFANATATTQTSKNANVVEKSQLSQADKAKFAGLSEQWPDRGLFLGLRKNVYVKQLKITLGLPEGQLNGNYDQDLKEAVAFYIKQNGVKDVTPDGSVVSYELYLKILNVDEDGNPLDGKNEQSTTVTVNSDKEQPKKTENTKVSQSPPTEHLRVNGNIFPAFLNEPEPQDSDYAIKIRYYIGQLQRCVNAKQTGRINQETIDKVKKFINDPRIKPLLVDSIDEESMDTLNQNGITAKLYNIVVHTRDRIIIKNDSAKTPQDIIN